MARMEEEKLPVEALVDREGIERCRRRMAEMRERRIQLWLEESNRGLKAVLKTLLPDRQDASREPISRTPR